MAALRMSTSNWPPPRWSSRVPTMAMPTCVPDGPRAFSSIWRVANRSSWSVTVLTTHPFAISSMCLNRIARASPDLKPVYAFDAYEQNPEEAIARWGTLAVRVLPYCKVNPNTGSRDDHFALWDDLAALADIADRPKRSQQERARTILGRSATDVSTDIRKKLGWLFGGRSDLWSIARDAISDSSWFAVFQDDNLWSVEDAAWVIAAWIAKDFQDRGRLECALEWQRRLGRPFTENIERRLAMTEGLDETWARVWRLFCLVEPIESDTSVHATQKRLVSGVVLNGDVRKAVSLLAPRLELNRRLGEAPADVGSQPITRFVDIAWPHMVVADEDGVEALIDTLCTMPGRAEQILDLATEELRSSLELEADLELIGNGYDDNDFTVASIESHDQNQHREGVNFLVRLLADVLPQAGALQRGRTRRVVIGWKTFPGRVGLRLCLHAMRNGSLFDADEAMDLLLSVSDEDFWDIRREVPLLLKERAGEASPKLIVAVEHRITTSGASHFAGGGVQSGEPDWREYGPRHRSLASPQYVAECRRPFRSRGHRTFSHQGAARLPESRGGRQRFV